MDPPPETFTKVDYNVMYYLKKFEVLRKFYCGSQLNFIQSMMSSDVWRDVTRMSLVGAWPRTTPRHPSGSAVRNSDQLGRDTHPQNDQTCRARYTAANSPEGRECCVFRC